MPKVKLMPGQKYHRLIIIKEAPPKNQGMRKIRMVLCLCDCGIKKVISLSAIRSGNSKSCGCLQKEIVAKTQTTHGLRYHRLNKTWRHMKDRCLNPNDGNYKDYGGRGIYICDMWRHNFKTFYDWAMDNGYDEKLTIERIDNDDGYHPGNCKFSTRVEQNNNKRNNKFFSFNGQKLTIPQWGRLLKINPRTLKSRIRRGWDIDKALNTPVRDL